MNKQPLLYKELTYKLRGCFFNVYNELGFGHKENIYCKALKKELEFSKIPFEQEKTLDVSYRDEYIGKYRPDFIAYNKIIIEIKAQTFLTKDNERQLIHYLKSTNYKLGFLVNFGSSKIEMRRIIWSPDYNKKKICENPQ